jgi:hypothetical protein
MDLSIETLWPWILVAAFVAVGIHLLLYARRRKKMLRDFARRHLLTVSEDYREHVQDILDRCFQLEQSGLVRSFSRISEVVQADGVWIFRAIELLRLRPSGNSRRDYSNRLAAVFAVDSSHQEFFLLDRSGQAVSRVPGAQPPDAAVTEVVQEAVRSCDAKHPLSVTLSDGQALIYFRPLIVGGEKPADIDAIYCLAREMGRKLR